MAAERTLKINITQRRGDFPGLEGRVNGQRYAFLDSAASAQKPRAVIEAMDSVYNSGYSNIHRGLYKNSQVLTEKFESVRLKIAQFIGASSEKSIVFTRNATEAINLVAASWGGAYLQAGDEIILTQMEHHANIVPWQLLAERKGLTIRFIPVMEDGTLDYDAFKTLLSPHTRLVAVTHISNALGTINNINEIIKICRVFNPEIKVLIDGSQGIIHGVVNVAKLDADFYVFTGHKLYGPTGIGVLYGKYELLESMPPYQGGGDMIDKVTETGSSYKAPPARFEAGTPPIVEVIGLGAAIDYIQAIGMAAIVQHETELRDYAMEQMQDIEGIRVFGTALEKAGIISFTLEGAHPSDIGMVLDQMGVAVRTGHHCCMPLMARFGVDATARASLGLYSDKDDINQLVEGLRKVKQLFS